MRTDLPKQLKGFSFIELLFAAAILAMLAGAATPFLEKTIQRKKEAELRENLRDIRKAIDAYKQASDQGKISKSVGDSGYPKRLEDLAEGVPDITDPQKKNLRFIRKIPADPMFDTNLLTQSRSQASLPPNPAETWGKRSYESDSNYPREGADVFDVYSRAATKGLNGVPYAQW